MTTRPHLDLSWLIRVVPDFPQPGVDVISAGGITHSAPALDMSLTVEG